MNEWNETYHVTGRLSNAFHIAGDATIRIIDELFPFMQDQPIHHQPPEDAQMVHQEQPVVPATTVEETNASPQTEGHSSIPTNEIKSEALQSEIKRECHVCQQTRKVQGKKRAKTTLPTRQYPSQ